MLKVTLKKPWRSRRGKLYPKGTVFIQTKMINRSDEPGAWYDFKCPNLSYGFVFIPDLVFRAFTDNEKWFKELQIKEKMNHLTKYNSNK